MEENVIFETQDGSHSILSSQFGVSYHSKYGAIQESRHVFIEAGLHRKALLQKEMTVLEIGFGTGLNAFLTLLAALEHQWQISYEGIDAYPVEVAQIAKLNYPTLLGAENRKPEFLQLHFAEWAKKVNIHPLFTFCKQKIYFEDVHYDSQFDLVYFDAFAPDTQPQLWEPPLLSKMYTALKPKGILVTYCAKGTVKRAFKSVGFQVEALPGPPGKREMTRCLKL